MRVPEIHLSDAERLELARTKATCPFISSAIAQNILPVRQSAANPLANIEDVRALGNSGGGDLGDLLALFATGNHALMRDTNGAMTATAPAGTFSLDFPHSQGSHAGDSGILHLGLRTHRPLQFEETEFARLIRRAENGRLNHAAVGEFIAENIRSDPKAKKLGRDVLVQVGHDLFELFEAAIPALAKHLVHRREEAESSDREVLVRVTKLLAEDNVVGSAGEFGLAFALLSGRPPTHAQSRDPVLLIDNLRLMFERKRLPDGWDTMPKTRLAWAKHTFAIAFRAYESLG